jgi:DNA-binding HxlR family transcriptional regulator
MKNGYGQFCPIAKAAEVFATRWTPLVLRELMSRAHTFNEIHQGVPLMSRALLAERLRQLEADGLVQRIRSSSRRGGEYHLTPAGEAFRGLVAALGDWGVQYARGRITADDLDPGLLLWAMRVRIKSDELPPDRVIVQFEFSGVPAARTKFQRMWLILERHKEADVCAKDPGYPIDLLVRCSITDIVSVFVGTTPWQSAFKESIRVEGDARLARALPKLLRLDKVPGRDMPFVHYNANASAA